MFPKITYFAIFEFMYSQEKSQNPNRFRRQQKIIDIDAGLQFNKKRVTVEVVRNKNSAELEFSIKNYKKTLKMGQQIEVCQPIH
jgi:hypothetical protein